MQPYALTLESLLNFDNKIAVFMITLLKKQLCCFQGRETAAINLLSFFSKCKICLITKLITK